MPVQVDVGFGVATSPPPELVEIPALLDSPPTRLMGYRRELVVAEKSHAMVDLGLANSRMKDFYDIWFLSRHFPFAGKDLSCYYGDIRAEKDPRNRGGTTRTDQCVR